ncbi:hypothetical protein Thiosp_01357 [Thiorhodovibrio litoralis]|nr:hypothetical protein Thiosp_01357 [Thiorhodovibrio litoralis]
MHSPAPGRVGLAGVFDGMDAVASLQGRIHGVPRERYPTRSYPKRPKTVPLVQSHPRRSKTAT